MYIYLSLHKVNTKSLFYLSAETTYSEYEPSVTTPQEVFERIESLANTLITVAKKM